MVPLLVPSVVPLLVKLHLQELHLLVVDRLVLLKLGLQGIVLLLYFFQKLFQLPDLVSLVVALRLFLLSELRDLSVKFEFQFVVLLLKLRLDIFALQKLLLQ